MVQHYIGHQDIPGKGGGMGRRGKGEGKRGGEKVGGRIERED